MSKTVKRERTKGHLERVSKERRERKWVRCMKADSLLDLFEVCPRPDHFPLYNA